VSGPSAGAYDPYRATFFSPQRTSLATGEPDIPTWKPEFKHHIRWVRQSTSEAGFQQQEVSVNSVVFRVRRTSQTMRIQPDWKFTHRLHGVEREYQITGLNALDYGEGEIELVAKSLFPC